MKSRWDTNNIKSEAAPHSNEIFESYINHRKLQCLEYQMLSYVSYNNVKTWCCVFFDISLTVFNLDTVTRNHSWQDVIDLQAGNSSRHRGRKRNAKDFSWEKKILSDIWNPSGHVSFQICPEIKTMSWKICIKLGQQICILYTKFSTC